MKNTKPATVHIALAEASNLLRSSLKSTLESVLHYKVLIEVNNGQELVEQIRAGKALPDICIVDLGMSQMNGYETLKVLKNEWPEMKVIIVSKYGHELLVRKTLAAGADSFLTMECTATLLCEAIDGVLENSYYNTTIMSKMILQKNDSNKKTHWK